MIFEMVYHENKTIKAKYSYFETRNFNINDNIFGVKYISGLKIKALMSFASSGLNLINIDRQFIL